jgi:hypothetical protein
MSENNHKLLLGLIPVIFFGLLPITAVIFLFITPENNFLGGVFEGFWLTALLGGSFFLGLKVWEIFDVKFIVFKKRQWRKRPGKGRIFFKITYPPDVNPSLANMTSFLGSLHAFFPGVRTKADTYNFGKGYYDFSFDFFIRQQKVDIFMAIPEEKCNILNTAFSTYYPQISFTRCDDPYKNWPETWSFSKGLGKFKDLFGTDFKLDQSGPYPLADPDTLSNNPNPISKLLYSYMDNDPEALIIMQYLVRPYENSKEKDWTKVLEDKKKEVLKKNSMFVSKDEKGKSFEASSTNLITDTQREIFGQCDAKLNQAHYKSHLRLVAFYEKDKKYVGDLTESDFKVFQGDTSGYLQKLEKNHPSSTNVKFYKSAFEFLDSIIEPFMEKWYYEKEREYRKRVMYKSLIGRDLDAPTDSGEMLIDTRSLASILHFPDGKLLYNQGALSSKTFNLG